VEGFEIPVGIINSASNGSTTVSIPVAATRYALVGVRQKSDRRNTLIEFNLLSVLANSADNLLIELYFGGTTATAPTFSPLTFSNMEAFDANTLGTAPERIHSGGVKIISYYVSGSVAVSQVVRTTRRLGSLIAGATEEAFLCATPLTTNASATAAVNWTEFI
jgi:hypothetical protein